MFEINSNRAFLPIESENVRSPIQQEENEKLLTLFSEAILKGNLNGMRDLIKDDAICNLSDKNKWSLLSLALHDKRMVELLLDNGIQVDLQNDDGCSALFVASMQGLLDVVKLLLDRGAKIDLQDNNAGMSAIWAPCFHNKLEIVQILLDHGASTDIVNHSGLTLLCFVSGKGHLEIVKLLLDRGAKINAKCKNGLTPLVMAAVNDHPDLVKELLQRGAIVNYKYQANEYTPLDDVLLLKKFHWKKIAQLILEKAPLALPYSKVRISQKFIAHITHFKMTELVPSDNNSNILITESGRMEYSWRKISKLISAFKLEFPDLIFPETADKIAKTAQLAANQQDVSTEEIFKKWQDGEPVFINCGYPDHGSSLLLWDNFLFLCDRAMHERPLMWVFDPEAMHKKVVKKINNKFLTKELYVDFFLKKLPNLLQADTSASPIVLGRQKTNNCAWVNAEGNVSSLMLLQAIKEAKDLPGFCEDKVLKIAKEQTKIFETWQKYVQITSLQKHFEKYIKQCPELNNHSLLFSALETSEPSLDADFRLVQKYAAMAELALGYIN